MKEAWRWFGPQDPVALDHVRQAGATDIVSALHQLKPGAVWTEAAVAERKNLIEKTPPGRKPLYWSVVESIPIPDDVKRLGKGAKQSIEAWIASLQAVAKADIKTVCYNFMPVVDWTRTDLDYELPTGATCLRFDQDRFAAFDLFILKRPGAERDYDVEATARAKATYDRFSEQDIAYLIHVIASALPGSTTDPLTIDGFRERLTLYRDIDAPRLRQHLVEFLEAVTPVADELGMKLTLHPDDPPRSLFGLPRIASTAADYAALFDAVPNTANGMCFCTGSLGVRPDNDLAAIVTRFAERIHFVHLRSTKRDADYPLSFIEADHLDGDVDMVSVISALIREDRKRAPGEKIPFRPDHGHRMLDDVNKTITPGYAGIGRLKGLGELRG
ncbi:MAG: mannonate dehydratase, partial [Alphaproteobacteria bacterium]|nr:mannonate dehydratase [Alphaproteobacteria bacterium]